MRVQKDTERQRQEREHFKQQEEQERQQRKKVVQPSASHRKQFWKELYTTQPS